MSEHDDPVRVLHDTELTRAVEAMEVAIGSGRWDDVSSFITPDLRYQVSQLAPVYGLEGLQTYMASQNRLVRWDGHEVRSRVDVEGVVIIEVDSFFHRHADAADIVVPCTDVYRMDLSGDSPRVADWRVYANISLFHPTEELDISARRGRPSRRWFPA